MAMQDDTVSTMQQAASRLWAGGSFWHVGGLAWQSASICDRDVSMIRFLTSGGSPSGWAWIEDGSHLNVLVGVRDAGGAQELVRWFVKRTDPAGLLTADVPEAATPAIQALLDAGFVVASGAPFSLDMRHDTQHMAPPPPLPAGFAVRGLEAGEEAAFVTCHRAAWNPHTLPWPERHRPDLPPEAASSFSESALAGVQKRWPYRQELAIVVVAPHGTLAASCIAWLDEANGVAEIEPLGVVPEYRGLGLGRAVCLEAVHRVGRLGGSEVTIHPRGDDGYPAARNLYTSCGFRTVARTVPLLREGPSALTTGLDDHEDGTRRVHQAGHAAKGSGGSEGEGTDAHGGISACPGVAG